MKRFTARVAAAMVTPLLFASITIATSTPAHAASYVPGVTPGFSYDPTTQTMYYTAWPGDTNDIEIFQGRVTSDDPTSPMRIAIDDDQSSHSFGTPNSSACSTGDLEDGLYSNDPSSTEALVHCDASKVRKVVVYGQDLDDTITVDADQGDSDLPSNITVEMHGGDGDDDFSGGYGTDLVYGDNGDDIYSGAHLPNDGNDLFDGGAGEDEVDYEGLQQVPVTVNLATGTAKNSIGPAPSQACAPDKPQNCVVDTLRNVEDVDGTNQVDSLTGDGNANVIHGLGSADFISGGGGVDKLYGDGGGDWIDARDNTADAVIDCGGTTGDLVAYDVGLETPVNCLTPPSPVTSAIDKAGNVYVFWKDTAGHLAEKVATNNVWGPTTHFDGVHFESFGQMTSQPTANVDIYGNVHVWWRGSDNRLWHAISTNGIWAGPYITPTGSLGSAPSAGTDAAGNEYMFWQGTENTLWNAWYDPALHFAHAAKPTGGQQLASHPAVDVQSNGFQHVWWQGADGHLYLVGCLRGVCTSPIDMSDNPTALVASPPAAVLTKAGNEYVYWKGTDGALWTRTFVSGKWTASKRIGFALASEPAVVLRADAWQQVFWMGTGGNIQEVDLLFTTWLGPYNRGN